MSGRAIVCQSSWLLTAECDDSSERQPERSAERVKRPEGRMSPSSEQVAQCAFVDASLTPKLATCPAAENASPIDRRDIHEPHLRRSHCRRCHCNGRHGLVSTTAMEGTVLRVPCIPASRARGFWRSSVRGTGPPGPKLSRGRPPLSAARRIPPAGCARFAAPAPPRLSRAARCAPECGTRSKPRRTRSAPHAAAAAPLCAGVALATHRDRSILSTSSQRMRPASRGTFQPRCGTFRASQNVPTTSPAVSLSPMADFIAHNVDETATTCLRRVGTFYRPFRKRPKASNPQERGPRP
jgi:hypothetical protein